MKRLALLTVLALVPASMVFAQSTLDDEINAELDRMYQTQSRNNAPSVQVNVQSSPNQNQVVGQESKTATVQTSTVETRTVQKQPTTVIESSPLGESRAERLRKARQDAELQTEEKLVERIEHSRLEDERRRAEVLFGDRFSSMMQKSEAKNEQAAEQKTEQKQVIVNKNYGVQGDVIQGASANQETEQKAELKAATKQEAAPQITETEVKAPVTAAPIYIPVVIKQEEEVKVKQDTEVKIVEKVEHKHDYKNESSYDLKKAEDESLKGKRGYVAGLIGMGDYPDVQNVRGNYSLGFAIGSKIDDRLLLEGSFQYSNYSIEQMDSGPWGYDPYYARITEKIGRAHV